MILKIHFNRMNLALVSHDFPFSLPVVGKFGQLSPWRAYEEPIEELSWWAHILLVIA